MRTRIWKLFWLAAMLLGLSTGAMAQSGTFSQMTGYPLSNTATVLEEITAGPDGALWFADFEDDAIGRITTAGAITEYPVPTPGASPFGIAAGPDGALWFTENGGNKIGRITTAGAITEYPLPTDNSSPWGIAAGPDGALWFAQSGSNQIGRITTAGAITEYDVPTPSSFPYEITAGPDGALWFTENIGNKIGRITTAGGITEYDVPTANSDPWKIVAGPDGALWFTEYGGGKIGRITTAGAITEYPLPNAQSVPTGITAARDKALWFTEYVSPSKIARITTAGLITEYPVPEVTEAWRIAAGPDGALWFTGNFSAEIGRAPDCGLGFSASFANSTLTMNFNLGIDTPATFNILLHSKAGAQRAVLQGDPGRGAAAGVHADLERFPRLGRHDRGADFGGPARGVGAGVVLRMDDGEYGAVGGNPTTWPRSTNSLSWWFPRSDTPSGRCRREPARLWDRRPLTLSVALWRGMRCSCWRYRSAGESLPDTG
jgi:virginiamycin B lyase